MSMLCAKIVTYHQYLFFTDSYSILGCPARTFQSTLLREYAKRHKRFHLQFIYDFGSYLFHYYIFNKVL